MRINYPSEETLISKAYQTTLGAECARLEHATPPERKGLLRAGICLVAGIAFTAVESHIAGILIVIGLLMLGVWLVKQSNYKSVQRRLQWCANACAITCQAVGGDPQLAMDLFKNCAGADKAAMLEKVRETGLELLRQNGGFSMRDGAVRFSMATLCSVPPLAQALSQLGDASLDDFAAMTQRMIQYHDQMSERCTRLASERQYGQMDEGFLRGTAGANSAAIAGALAEIEATVAPGQDDILAVARLDLPKIQRVLYMAAQASPPVSAELYQRAEALAQMAFGQGANIPCPDVMLAQLVRSKQYSLERVKRETGAARQWIEQFLKHSTEGNDEKLCIVRSFCGALKGLQLYGIERACLEAAEKQLGFLDGEMTSRLDYLTRGGGSMNARVTYYGNQFRQDVLPVDYGTVQMNPGDVDWLFNEARGQSGAGAGLVYGLAWKLTQRVIELPSPSIRPDFRAVRAAIQSSLDRGALVSNVSVLMLDTRAVINCLKIRMPQYPTLAFLLDISLDGKRMNVRVAVCWVPVTANGDQQRQQCLQLWSNGESGALACVDKVLFAIETEIQRTVDRWRAAQQTGGSVANPGKTVNPTYQY